jgi:streptogramin lyase
MKQVLYVACTGCHSLSVALQNRFDQSGWKTILQAMESATYNGWRGRHDIPAAELMWEGQIIRHHEDELAKFLSEVRGANAPLHQLHTLPRPTGDAARAVVTEYELPIAERKNEMPWYTGADWSLGPSTGMHGIVGVHDVFVDNDGLAWISQSRITFETNRSLLKLNPQTGDMKVFNFEDDQLGQIFVEQMGQDPMGNIWMHDYSKNARLIKLDPRTETFTAYPVPKVMLPVNNSTTSDSKGRIFVNGSHGALEFDPSELGKTDVAYPGWHLYQQHTPGNGINYGIAADSEDNIWWSEAYADKVAERNMKTGKVYEIDMHDPGYDERKALFPKKDLDFYDSIGAETWAQNSAEPLPYANMPRRLSADKKGSTVWVPNWADSNVAEIDIHTRQVRYHPLPQHAHPYQTSVDKDHNVWTDVGMLDGIFRFRPKTNDWTLFQLPSHGCGSRHSSVDDIRGEVWVPCDQSDKVARFQFRTADDIARLKRAAIP